MFFKSIMRKNGSFLLEALMTVCILSIGIVLIIRSHISSLRSLVYSKSYSTAAFLIQNKMNELIQQGIINQDLDERNFLPPPYEKFEYHLKAQKAGDRGAFENLSEVLLTLSWKEGRNKKRVSASTYLFNSF